jgi:hypothetical protein
MDAHPLLRNACDKIITLKEIAYHPLFGCIWSWFRLDCLSDFGQVEAATCLPSAAPEICTSISRPLVSGKLFSFLLSP